MSVPKRLRWRLSLAVVVVVVATGCAASDGESSAALADDPAADEPAADEPAADEPAADDDVAEEAADAAPVDDVVDGPPEGPLYVDDLHAGLSAGDPGTAVLEVDGRTFELRDATCEYQTFDGGEIVIAEAIGDSDVGPLELSVTRRLSDADEGTEKADVTLARLSDDEGRWADWASAALWEHTGRSGASYDLGGGEVPLVRAVEDTAISARGELAFLPLADGELSGPFELVVTCP